MRFELRVGVRHVQERDVRVPHWLRVFARAGAASERAQRQRRHEEFTTVHKSVGSVCSENDSPVFRDDEDRHREDEPGEGACEMRSAFTRLAKALPSSIPDDRDAEEHAGDRPVEWRLTQMPGEPGEGFTAMTTSEVAMAIFNGNWPKRPWPAR